MGIAVALALVVIGSVVFHFLSPWWWTPIASNWGYIDDTIIITFWITGVVFAAVVLFMAYCVFRFRHREGSRAAYEPENKRLEWWLAIGTGVGVAAMLAPGLVVWNQFVTVPKDATTVEVVGQQWQWSYRLPGADGRLGASDVAHVTPENPLGLDPKDPHGQDDVIIQGDQLHLPLGKPVKMLLRSLDVAARFLRAGVPRQDGHDPGQSSPITGSRRRGSAPSRCFAPSSAAPATPSCAAASWSSRRAHYQAWLQQQKTFAQLQSAGQGGGEELGMDTG